MDLEKLEPNSHKYNAEKKEILNKVSVNNAKVKKKSLGHRFADLFLSDDVGDIKEYLIGEIIIPSIKDGIVDALQKGTEMLFYGKTRARSGRSTASYTSYGSFSRPQARPKAYSSKSIDDIILETRDEAEDVIEVLQEILDKYKQVTVADLYDAVGVTGNGYTDNYYGWVDLDGIRTVKCREGYLLELPRCVDLR